MAPCIHSDARGDLRAPRNAYIDEVLGPAAEDERRGHVAAGLAPVPMYPLGRVTTASNEKPTPVASVVRKARVAPAATGAVRTACRAVLLSVVIEAVPPEALKLPMFAIPSPRIVMIVPTGRGAVEDARRVNPGPTRPGTPNVPRSAYARTNERTILTKAAANGAAGASVTAGTAHAAPRICVRPSAAFSRVRSVEAEKSRTAGSTQQGK